MDAATVDEVMDAMEARAEATLQLLSVLDNAQMMHVTRAAIVETMDEELRRERRRFQALRRGMPLAERSMTYV